MKEKLAKNPKLKALVCGGGLIVLITGVATYGLRGGPESHFSEMATNPAPVTRSIVAESPFTQVQNTSEFLGGLIAFLNIIEPNPEGYPPLYLAGFGLGSSGGLQAFLAEAESYPSARVMRVGVDSTAAFRVYEQATDYYKAHHKPEGSPISQEEIKDFNKAMDKALERLPNDAGYLALSAVDAYRNMVKGSARLIGSYAKSPRVLPSPDALEAMEVFKDLRLKYAEHPAKSKFVVGESLSSALGALSALVSYDSDRLTDAQYALAYVFIDRVLVEFPDSAQSRTLSQGLFTRSYEHAVNYLKEFGEAQGGKLHDRDKAILIYQVMDVIAEQGDPFASIEIAEYTLDYWSKLDPFFSDEYRMLRILDPDYRTPTKVMFQARSPELKAYAAHRGVEIAKAQERIERMRLREEQLRAEFNTIAKAEAKRAELEAQADADAIRIRKVIKKVENHE